MSSLILYLSQSESFDADVVIEFLRNCLGVYNIKQNPDERVRVTAHYDFGGDTTHFYLGAGLKSAGISGTGTASLAFCCMLQSSYPKPIHVIDQSYCFDLVISDFNSVSGLGEAMRDAENNTK